MARLAAAGVTTSTLGLGRDFNEGLMTLIARAGRGRAYYGETAEDLMAPFREEFDLLNAIAGRKVSCLLKPVTGVTMEVLNPYPRDPPSPRNPRTKPASHPLTHPSYSRTRLSRKLFVTTKIELNAIAPAARIGLRNPSAAAGISTTL